MKWIVLAIIAVPLALLIYFAQTSEEGCDAYPLAPNSAAVVSRQGFARPFARLAFDDGGAWRMVFWFWDGVNGT